MKKRILINRHVINANRKHNKADPPISVQTYKSNDYTARVDILDAYGEVAATVCYQPQKPMSCGATVWIETENEVSLSSPEVVTKDTSSS